ncbi:Checkpoint protein hus1 [Malassezia equina]|uniref:Checkpoint protein hus1 n=1 Tax=Malassezia equina TaxID=1381935 RepID=A0AAF0EAB9_9BASI|nr:Checkpoint protein hus1 [Malassezia equina]
MRLRASVTNVALLAGLLHTAAGVSSPCYLHFTPTKFRLIAPAGHDGVQIWATLDVGSVFANYRIESHNHNEITVEVVAESLARALRSAAGATEVMLRLGKRDGEPLLSLSIGMASHTGAKLDVTQDVLVRILRVSEMNLITEPMCPTPDVRVLALTDAVKAMAEQIRPLATQVCLGANHSGALRLAVMDSDVVGEATWTGLEHPSVQAAPAARPDADPHVYHEVHLNAPPWVPGKLRVSTPRTNTYPFATDSDACLAAYAAFVKESHPDPEVMNQELVSPMSETWDWLWPNMPNRVAQTSPLPPEGSYALSPQGTQPATAPPPWLPPYKNYPMDAKEAVMHGATVPTAPLGFHGAYRKSDSHPANTDRTMQEISTLFMAGFPEDMTDREFSNMFLFAKGFEASMLKYPQPSKSEDDIRKAGDRYNTWPPIEREVHKSPSQREPEQPSAKNRQIIGFAKFSTREEALQARDILNGFRIDTERGCILKAELAKKNLHTKRTVPFIVTKHGHPAGHAKPAREFAMGDPAAVPVNYAALSGRTGSLTSHASDMLSDDHAPMAPMGVHPMMDPRGAAAAWPDAMDPKHVQANMEAHGLPTTVPISEMVGRLENFSKTIPTFAGQRPGAVPAMSENPSSQWPRTSPSPVGPPSNQAAPVHADRLRPNLALTPLDMTHGMMNLSLGHGQGLHKSPESTMMYPVRDSSGSSTMDGANSLSGLTRANTGTTSGSEIWSMSSQNCTSPSQVNMDEYLSPSAEQRPAPSGQDVPLSQRSGESESKNTPTPTFDLNEVTDLDQEPYTDGFQEGHAKGQFFGRLEGRALGREKGFELWTELGYYIGVMHMYQESLKHRAQDGLSRKAQKQTLQIEQFLQLCDKMPLKNNSTDQLGPVDDDIPDLEKLLERIRAKYRLLCKSVGFEALGPASEDAGATRAVAPSKGPNLVQIAGQFVDVNQLTY